MKGDVVIGARMSGLSGRSQNIRRCTTGTTVGVAQLGLELQRSSFTARDATIGTVILDGIPWLLPSFSPSNISTHIDQTFLEARVQESQGNVISNRQQIRRRQENRLESNKHLASALEYSEVNLRDLLFCPQVLTLETFKVCFKKIKTNNVNCLKA